MAGARGAALVLAALALVGSAAPPARAHTRASNATNVASRIERAPELPAITWRVYPGGEYLAVSNDGVRELVVLGYSGEPYLRIGPHGVLRNRNSPATYLNAERSGDVAVPPRAAPDAAPTWEHLSGEPRYAWHDHRTHARASSPPRAVDRTTPAYHSVSDWTVPIVHAGERHAVHGRLLWVPHGRGGAWLALGLALTAGALLGLLRRDRRGVTRPAALVVGVVALVNLVHLPDEFAALPVPPLDVVFGVLHNLLFIGAGLIGAAVAWRQAGRSLLPLGIASGAVLFHQGLLQVAQLPASQLATIWPAPVIRLAVALSLGQAVWVALVIVMARRRHPAGNDPQAQAGTKVPVDAGPSSLWDAQPSA